MNTIEVMKQALEALDRAVHYQQLPEHHSALHETVEASKELRAAIAELENAQPKEPVAYVCGTYAGRFIVGPVNGATVLPDGMALYAAPPAQAIPTGWKLVPEKPTAEMVDAAEKLDWTSEDVRGNCINQWQAMLAAAPQPPKE